MCRRGVHVFDLCHQKPPNLLTVQYSPHACSLTKTASVLTACGISTAACLRSTYLGRQAGGYVLHLRMIQVPSSYAYADRFAWEGRECNHRTFSFNAP